MTRKSIIPDSLSKNLRDFLVGNVRMEYDPDVPFGMAGVCLDRNGYTLVTGPRYRELSDTNKTEVLLHEIAHILRGDCVTIAKHKLNPLAWNIAADAGINYGLNESVVKEIQGIWYPNLIEDFPNELPRDYLPSTKQIYDAMKQYADGMEGQDSLQVRGDAGDLKDMQKAHAKVALEAREMLKDCPEMQEHLANLTHGLHSATARRVVQCEPMPLPLASVILKHLHGQRRGSRFHCRTYAREGRVEELRGTALLPRLSILSAIDVSGSCTHLVPKFVGASKWLARRHSVDLVAFDTEVHKFSAEVPMGGGTCFRPVWNHAKRERADAVIMLTDGEAGDINPLPDVPVIWIVPKNYSKPPLRPSDKLICLDL